MLKQCHVYHPFANGLYHLLMVKLGMVYDCFTNMNITQVLMVKMHKSKSRPLMSVLWHSHLFRQSPQPLKAPLQRPKATWRTEAASQACLPSTHYRLGFTRWRPKPRHDNNRRAFKSLESTTTLTTYQFGHGSLMVAYKLQATTSYNNIQIRTNAGSRTKFHPTTLNHHWHGVENTSPAAFLPIKCQPECQNISDRNVRLNAK